MTFGLMYAWSERFILPLSHDEVVHLKGSLLGKMSGDPWQRFANLRALFGWMWAHPGKKLLFMGGELAEEREWAHDSELDWRLLDDPAHAGVHRLMVDLGALYASVAGALGARREPQGIRVDRRRQRGSEHPQLRPARRSRTSGHRLHRQLRARGPLRLPGRACRSPATGPRCSTPIPTTTAAAASATWARSRPRTSPCTPSRIRRAMTLPPLAVLWLAPPRCSAPLLNAGPFGENGCEPAGREWTSRDGSGM